MGGCLFDYSVTPGPGLSKVRYLVMPGHVKARAKELDNIRIKYKNNHKV